MAIALLRTGKAMSLMWARLIVLVPLALGGVAFAQSAGELATPVESCSRSARLADAVCRNESDPKLRGDCFRDVSAAQLKCLETLPSGGATASQDPATTVSSVPSTSAAPGISSNGASPEQPDQKQSDQKQSDTVATKPADNNPQQPAGAPEPAAAQETATQQPKPVASQTEAMPEPANRAADPAATASVPKRTRTAGNRSDGLLCMHFRTYDAASGTYRGYDGRVRECRQAQEKLLAK
ncbi:MAG: hypothetical protein GY844_04210 [Bradyrhizobium sp.]|nr:hypothetical protein [Bradyrhizobium sp.]